MTRIALFALIGCLVACDQPKGETTTAGISAAAAKAPEGAAPAASGGAASSSTAYAAGEPAPETVVATWEGGQVTYGELHDNIKSELTKLEVDYLNNRYETQNDGLQNMVVQRLMENEAKARGLADANALLEAEVRSKVTDPTDAEVADFYPQVQRQLRNKPLEEVKDQVKGALRQKKERERFMAFVDELKTKAGLQITLPMPDLPRMDVSADDDPVRGSPQAKVTVIQFADFQCPYCGRAYETTQKILKDYDGKVKMVFRDFPLGFHERAIPTAIAVNCAADQGKYWEMFDQIMPNQRSISDDDLTKYATGVGLDMDKWNTCRKDPTRLAEIQKDQSDGAALGITGTPAFFIDGIMLSGAQPYDSFKAIIDRELAGS